MPLCETRRSNLKRPSGCETETELPVCVRPPTLRHHPQHTQRLHIFARAGPALQDLSTRRRACVAVRAKQAVAHRDRCQPQGSTAAEKLSRADIIFHLQSKHEGCTVDAGWEPPCCTQLAAARATSTHSPVHQSLLTTSIAQGGAHMWSSRYLHDKPPQQPDLTSTALSLGPLSLFVFSCQRERHGIPNRQVTSTPSLYRRRQEHGIDDSCPPFQPFSTRKVCD